MLVNTQKMMARRVTEKVLANLYNAKEQLEKARGWGVYDLLGGGFLSSGLKHDKINQAQQYIHQAQREMRNFSYEFCDKLGLNDIQDVRTNDLTGFLDIFMDNPISDISMQSRISNTLNQVDDSIERVEYLLDGLAA